jgi:integrase/recombinase XerD
MLLPDLLDLLRVWWKEGDQQGVMLPCGWLSPGQNLLNLITTRQPHRVAQDAAQIH